MAKKYYLTSKDNILIRAPHWLGDHVMCLDLYKKIRAYFQNNLITLVCKKNLWFQDLHNYFDEAFFIEDFQAELFIQKPNKKFTLSINLSSSFSSNYLLFRLHIPIRFGFYEPVSYFFVTRGILWRGRKAHKHKSELYSDIFHLLTSTIKLQQEDKISGIRKHTQSSVISPLSHTSLPNQKKKLILLHPFASITLREWPYFKELIEKLSQHKDTITLKLLGTQSEWKRTPWLVDKKTTDPLVEYLGTTTLDDLIQIIKRSTLFIGNDSGLGHLASTYLSKPSIILFGPGDEAYIRPQGPSVTAIRAANIPCAPCEKSFCHKKYGYKVCLTSIDVEYVYKKCLEMVNILTG